MDIEFIPGHHRDPIPAKTNTKHVFSPLNLRCLIHAPQLPTHVLPVVPFTVNLRLFLHRHPPHPAAHPDVRSSKGVSRPPSLADRDTEQ